MWVSLGAGLFDANSVSDGRTGSSWAFGEATTAQYRAALEKAINASMAVGVVTSFSRVPFTYIGTDGPESCARCDAHMNVVSLGGSFHYGGGAGLHQVVEASAGVLQYRDLRRDAGGDLAPTNGNIDPYITFGYGFGYAFNPVMQLSIVQDFGIALHEREGLTSEQSNALRQRTLRLNFRYGFGNRWRRR